MEWRVNGKWSGNEISAVHGCTALTDYLTAPPFEFCPVVVVAGGCRQSPVWWCRFVKRDSIIGELVYVNYYTGVQEQRKNRHIIFSTFCLLFFFAGNYLQLLAKRLRIFAVLGSIGGSFPWKFKIIQYLLLEGKYSQQWEKGWFCMYVVIHFFLSYYLCDVSIDWNIYLFK